MIIEIKRLQIVSSLSIFYVRRGEVNEILTYCKLCLKTSGQSGRTDSSQAVHSHDQLCGFRSRLSGGLAKSNQKRSIARLRQRVGVPRIRTAQRVRSYIEG